MYKISFKMMKVLRGVAIGVLFVLGTLAPLAGCIYLFLGYVASRFGPLDKSVWLMIIAVFVGTLLVGGVCLWSGCLLLNKARLTNS
jgi:hypothetical protein